MDWNRLKVFHAVAEAGSFTHAGEALNLSQSAISRQISALEGELRTSLFHRHARGLILTEQGEIMERTAREMLAETEAALPVDVAVFAAAVADWRSAYESDAKIKKSGAAPTLQLV